MPQMGESVTEGTILEWHVAEGQEVAEGDTVVEVSTDKVDAEVPAPADGVITKLLVSVDDEVPVGAPLAEMEPGEGTGEGPNGAAAGPVADDGGALRAGASSTPPSPTPPAEEAPESQPAAKWPTATAPTAQAAGEGLAKPATQRPRPSLSGVKLPKDRGALIGLGAGALVVIVLILVLALSSDGDGGSDTTGTTGTPESLTDTSAGDERLTQAILEPTDGGDASGRALFGRFKENVLLQVQAEGLDPSPRGQSYSVWLYRSPKLALRIGAVRVGEDGKIAVQIPIPTEVLAYVAGGAFGQVDVSLTDDAAYKAEVARAKSEQRLPRYTGTSVLRGEITGPAIKAASGS
jgi:Biotin-requiring enzyme